MQAIEFQATAFQHSIKIPDYVPDGISFRVLLLVEDNKISLPAKVPNAETIKAMKDANNGNVHRYDSAKAMWADLDSD
jgi:hypothetical protein